MNCIGPITSAPSTMGGLCFWSVSHSIGRFFLSNSGWVLCFQVRIDWWETSESWRMPLSHSSLMDETTPRLIASSGRRERLHSS